MNVKYLLCICAAAVLVAQAVAAEEEAEYVEESTESPIADLPILDAVISSSEKPPGMRISSSEKPPGMRISSSEKPPGMRISSSEKPPGMRISSSEKPPGMRISSSEKPPGMRSESEDKPATQRHTVADFIIHPLIAFKPRVAEEDLPAGKQATVSSTTASPWQLFGFNTGQGLGSQVSNSVSSLAGSVTGWINDRIQLPGLVDTPVRDATTTTTTLRPDIVVQVQQNRRTTRRPIIRINQNQNNRPNNFNNNRPNRRNRPNRFNNNNNQNNFNNNNNLGYDEEEDEYDDQEEYDDSHYNNNNNNNRDEEEHEDDDAHHESAEESDDADNHAHSGEEEEDDDEEVPEKPVNNKRRAQSNQPRRRPQNTRTQPKRRLTATQQYGFIDEESSEHDDSDNSKNNNHEDDEDDDAEDVEHYYYEEVRPATKRSQTQPNLIQRGQQSLINQIRQLTQGLSPDDVVATNGQRRPQQNTKRQRQQAAVLINRNGQTFYVAPELLSSAIPLTNNAQQYQYFAQGGVKKVAKKPSKASAYPQPPLTVPLKRKGRPTQYITIPWTQLGIAPPNELVSITDGVQSKPLILNIPQNAINAMQNPNRRKNRPAVSAGAVPLLAEASLMDIFKPPRIPPSRTTTSVNKGTPVYIASKGGIRPATIVEKAPAMAEAIQKLNESDDAAADAQQSETNTSEVQKTEGQYIIVGEDNEPGLTRHVQPVYGDARYVQINGRKPIYELLNRGRFALRKSGRALEQPEAVDTVSLEQQKAINREQQIPVQIINEAEEPQSKPKQLEQEEPIAPQPTQASPVVDAAPVIVEAISAPVVEQEAAIKEATPTQEAAIKETIPVQEAAIKEAPAAVVETKENA